MKEASSIFIIAVSIMPHIVVAQQQQQQYGQPQQQQQQYGQPPQQQQSTQQPSQQGGQQPLVQQYTGGTPPEFTVDETPTVAPITAMEMIEKFYEEKGQSHGWSQGPFTTNKGSEAISASGVATIGVDRSKRGFILSREIAFQKALLRAKQALIEFLDTTISANLETEFNEPAQKRQEDAFEKAKHQGIQLQSVANAGQAFAVDLANQANKLTGGAFDKSVGAFTDNGDKLLKLEMNKKLKEMGLDPSQPIDKQVLKEVMGTDSFKRAIRAVSKSRISGVQVYKTFEALPSGKDGEIGVVILQSKRLTQLADSIFTGSAKLAPGAVNGKPLSQQIPRDKNILVGTFGAKFVKDNRNQWCILSYGQAEPRSEKSRYLSSAMKKAKLNAMAMIRQFAGEMAQSETTKEDSEDITDFMDGTQDIEMNEEFVDKMKTSAAAKSISGMAQVKSWSHKHPLTGQTVAGSVVSWCPSSMVRAKKLQRSMQAPPPPPPSQGVPGQAPMQGQQRYAAPPPPPPPVQRNQGTYYGSGVSADDDF